MLNFFFQASRQDLVVVGKSGQIEVPNTMMRDSLWWECPWRSDAMVDEDVLRLAQPFGARPGVFTGPVTPQGLAGLRLWAAA
jgi:hypothetical protein